MLLPALTALLLAVGPALPSAPTAEPRPDPPRAAGDESPRGDVDWFEGGYEAALAEARRSDRIVFLDFWSKWCPWCQAMGRETLTDPSVVAALADGMVCVSLDTQTPEGVRIAGLFGVRGVPSMLFLEPDGSPHDALSGFLTAPRFRAEIARIRRGDETVSAFRERVEADPDDLVARLLLATKLRRFARTVEAEAQMAVVRRKIEAGQGFQPRSIESRWALASKLREVGELDLYREQADAILRLDPKGTSLAARSIAVYDAIERLRAEGDDARLRTLLADETDPGLLFEGWRWVASLAEERAQRADRTGAPEDVAAARREARAARTKAWPHCPPTNRALFANNLAWSFFEDREQLTDAERRFALDVARVATDLEPGNVLILDTLACCLWMNGMQEEALAAAERCIELDPGNKEWKKRHAQITKDA